MSIPVQTRLISEARRGKIKREDVDFVITAINHYYKELVAVGAMKEKFEPVIEVVDTIEDIEDIIEEPTVQEVVIELEEPKELTPAQKAAITRAKNKAKKLAE